MQFRFKEFDNFRVYPKMIRDSPGSCKLEAGIHGRMQESTQLCTRVRDVRRQGRTGVPRFYPVFGGVRK